MVIRARARDPRSPEAVISPLEASRPRGSCDCHPGGGARARRRAIPDRRRLSSHRQSASRPRGTCDGHPGGARDPDRRRPSSHRPPASRPRGTRTVTGHSFVGARTSSAGRRRPLSAGQSAASLCSHRARARGRAGSGSGRSLPPAGGQTLVSPHRHQASQSSRRAPVVRQVWSTDSDTSWRRRDRRSTPGVTATGTAGSGHPPVDRFTRGPRSHVCLDVACPCSPFLPPFTSCTV